MTRFVRISRELCLRCQRGILADRNVYAVVAETDDVGPSIARHISEEPRVL